MFTTIFGRRAVVVLIAIVLILGAAAIRATNIPGPSVPQLINYQGRLMDGTGAPVTGARDLTFGFYGSTTGGNAYLTVLQEGVVVNGGLYSVLIGSGPITAGTESSFSTMFAHNTYIWMGVKVGTEEEMTPRVLITSVPFAFHAGSLDQAWLAEFIGAFMANPDWDNDGYTKTGPNPDCNDGYANIHPNAPELCDGRDNQCPGDGGYGQVDEGCLGECVDYDLDGYGPNCALGPDCDNLDENNWNSCATCVDQDDDFYYTGCDDYLTILGPDCEDSNSGVNPGETEVCDMIDNDCDLEIDEGSDICPDHSNAQGVCTAGVCGVECDPDFGDCNASDGCETFLVLDPMNCMACNNVCPMLPNSTPECMGGCTFFCMNGFMDCDSEESNGCEIMTLFDHDNCGVCAHVCGPTQNCVMGNCQ